MKLESILKTIAPAGMAAGLYLTPAAHAQETKPPQQPHIAQANKPTTEQTTKTEGTKGTGDENKEDLSKLTIDQLIARGKTSFSQENYQQAVTFYQAATQKPTTNDNKQNKAEAYLRQGLALYKMGLEEKAIQSFQNAKRKNPTIVTTALVHEKPTRRAISDANYLIRDKKFKEAHDALQRIVKKDQESAAVQYAIGCLYAREDKQSEAIQHFEKAIMKNPFYLAPYTRLGTLHDKLGNKQKSVFYDSLTLLLRPDHPQRVFLKNRIKKNRH